jgi:hypothetical protein
MCTVTYLPTPTGFILTHNRDEAPSRSPQGIDRDKVATDTLLFPRDTRAGGTWIATARSGKTACVLNGAFLKHRHEPPYRRSRGLMLLDFFEYREPARFLNEYLLEGIEPFTFLYFGESKVRELRWDGGQRYLRDYAPDQAAFWCSATLYPPEMQTKRENIFRSWLEKHDTLPNPAAAFRLHRTGSVGDPENDYVMNRGGRVQTVSITQVRREGHKIHMRYLELQDNKSARRSLTVS